MTLTQSHGPLSSDPPDSVNALTIVIDGQHAA